MKIAVLQIVIAFPRSIKHVVYISSHIVCRAAICLPACVWREDECGVWRRRRGKKKVLDLFQEPAQVIMLETETLSALKNGSLDPPDCSQRSSAWQELH